MKLKLESTHCFCVKNGKVLLGMKKRGFGKGKWNGIGGKKHADDKTIVHTFIRETQEEIGVTPLEYKKMAILKFIYKSNPDWDQKASIFVTTKWKGKPVESEEEKPKWWPINKLPFYSMWQDDPSWLPLVLAGIKVKATYVFDMDNKIEKVILKTGK